MPSFSTVVTARRYETSFEMRWSVSKTPLRADPSVRSAGPALRAQVAAAATALRGGPILAVVKNSAYGLSIATAGRVLDLLPEISGFAVVRPGEAIALRAAGVKKPILLMGPAS